MSAMPSSKQDLKPPIGSQADAHAYSLREWQLYFESIYSKGNAIVKREAFSKNSVAFIRGYSIAHISQDLGNLAEQIREGDNKKMRRYVGSLFAWICALCSESGLDIEKTTWNKYPGRCPHCGKAKDCADAWWTSAQMKKGKHPTHTRKAGSKPPKSLDGWVSMWEEIYGSKVRVAIPLHDVMHKLYEELAEVLDEYDKSKKFSLAGVRNEVPDFLSWLFSLIIKLRQYNFLVESDKLADILYDKFSKGCNSCGKPSCECTPKWV